MRQYDLTDPGSATTPRVMIAAEETELERKLQWQLANAVCVIDMLMRGHIGVVMREPDGKALTLIDISGELADRIDDVFKDYP